MAESKELNDLVIDNSLNIDELQTESNVLNSDENHKSIEVSNLDDNLLSSNNTENTVTLLCNQDLPDDKEVDSIIETNVLNSDENLESTELYNLDGNLLSNNNTDNTLTSLHNQDLPYDTEVDSIVETNILNSDENHKSTELSNLDSNLLSSNYTENSLTPLRSQDSPYDTEVDPIIKTNLLNTDENDESTEVSNLDNNLLSHNDTENTLTPLQSQDLPYDTEINPVIETNLNSDENDESTKVSNLDSNLLSHNDTENKLTPFHNHDSLNDAEVDSIIDKSIINNQNLDYKIGDIVWARIGKYPFWPSVVCVDPTSNTYIKDKKFMIHVRFCNDKGRRSWTRFVEKFLGKNEFFLKYPNCFSTLKYNKKLLATWDLAIEEAEHLCKLDGKVRMIEFFKTFSTENVTCVTPSSSNSCEGAATELKVCTYSRKRSLTISEQGNAFKLFKTENISVDGSTSSRSIDISLLSKSDDIDSTLSDISMNSVYIEDALGLKKRGITRKRRSTKTYLPKSSNIDKYNSSDLIMTSPEYNDDNILPYDPDKLTATTMTSTSTRMIPLQRKHEIRMLEGYYEQEDEIYSNSRYSKRNVISKSSSNSKKTAIKKPRQRKSTSTKNKSESSPEPDTAESEVSSKNETFSSIYVASTKNKQLFIKTLKRACVVCKNIEDTIKCMGPCQSYFHKECLDKSEERYHKSEPKIKIKNKKYGRSKRQYTKSSVKNRNSVTCVPQLTKNINDTDIDELNEKDNTVTKSLNGLKSLPNEQGDLGEEIKVHDLLELNKTEKDSKIIIGNVHEIELNEIENLSKESIEENSDPPIISTDSSVSKEKLSKPDLQYLCSLCRVDKTYCYICGLDIEDSGQRIACKISSCGKYYHENCLRDWPQCQWIQGSRNNIRTVICPHHVCHLCISDNPKSSCQTHFPAEKLSRCIKCPTAYHRSEYCLPAGSEVLTYSDIVCSRHFEPLKLQNYHYNATWCFICTLGGALICCDLCPSSFHIECLNQNPSEFVSGFTCEECQTGRYPLYGEIVWVKIGNYRWWPAQIVFPNQVPDTVNAIAHSVGQFAVRFFGSYDYYWVNRGRVFNFHEGDDENILTKSKMKVIDQVFQDAIIEAAQAHNAYILDKDKNDAIVAKKYSTRPPKFVRIKFNKPFGNVKNMELNTNTMTPCECDSTKPNPCGPGSDCINRMLMFECQPQICPAGDKCNNQRFTKTIYPNMVPFLTKGRGWGLKTLEDIKEGSFVIEYVGDVIDEEEFQRRCLEMHQRNEQNYYFLTIDNSRMIDAGPKGNLSRFMNHSCEPNCVTQKWTVNGDTRIGLFALHDIPSGTELVFDYRLQSCSGVEKKPCQCGAARCSKFIGVKVEEEKKKMVLTNDAEKSKTTTKNKRKPLKLKDNISDSEKSKSNKVTKNDQNISTAENEVNVTKVERDDSKKPKNKASVRKLSSVIKNENSVLTDSPNTIQKKWKNSNKISTNITKVDNNVNSLELEENIKSKRKLKHTLSTPSRKQFIKDYSSDTDDSIVMKKKRKCKRFKKKNVIKTDLLPLPKNLTDLSTATTLCLSEGKDNVAGLSIEEDMKTNESINCIKDFKKTEQNHEVLKTADVIKPDKCTITQEKSRHSLTRLAKSRHSFLSKNDTNKDKNEQPILFPKRRKFSKEKKNTTKVSKTKQKCREIVLKTIEKKNKMNKQSLLSKAYFQNDSCLVCGKGQTELACKNKKCPRVFHLSCMNKTRIVKSGYICPSHFCSVCNKRKVVAKCKFCVESFCSSHTKGNIFKDPLGHGMLCTTHHPSKKSIPPASIATYQPNKQSMPLANVPLTPSLNSHGTSKINTINNNLEPVDLMDSNLDAVITETVPDVDEGQFDIDIDEINEEEYTLTQVIKDECDREYIHIGGFNVCNMSDLASDQVEEHLRPVDTDGDLFKPSSANVVIDIDSASALYQPTDTVQLVSIASENKDNHNYANIQFVPDTSQTKNKWLAAEP
ncbi:uncharacterized protein LOC112680773 isoform X2 [Sipha flava]|uniref:Uncharacterized protein LOC112680773 isoform X2 n=1 Tax=Sipha flava TaxID=143950 RepID=A0A8B8F7F5_9HEMI|nr:uncharacterized protein LOC112680773 isoform X2 [Sipha flava]